MAILNLSVSDDLDERFREAASTYFGNKKGNLAKAATESFEFWIGARNLCKKAGMPPEQVMAFLRKVLQKLVADQPEG
jgi:hypothetical protein